MSDKMPNEIWVNQEPYEWGSYGMSITETKGVKYTRIPEGYVLVPVEPDFNMKMHGIKKMNEAEDLACSETLLSRVYNIYKAMLASAPKTQGGGE